MPHFMIVLILYINFIKPFLDENKMTIFEEYGAFNETYYKDVVLKKLKKILSETTSSNGFQRCSTSTPIHLTLLHFFAKRDGNSLSHTSYSPDLALCDFFLFPKLKTSLSGQRYQSRQTLGSAVYQYLTSIPKSAYRDAFRKWTRRLYLFISSHGDYFEGMK